MELVSLDWQAIGAVGQVAGTLAAAAAIWWGFRGVKRQMWLATFSEFTGRYAVIIDRLPQDARRPGNYPKFATLPPDHQNLILSAFRQYFNLCSEEHYLAEERILDRKTWGIWSQGIVDAFRNSVFRDGWEYLRIEYEMYPAFCGFMDQSADRGSNWKPAEA